MTTLPPRSVTTTPATDVTDVYAAASGDRNPIHLDDEAARAAGLPGRIVHGYWTMAQVVRVALEEVEGDPRRLRRLEIRLRDVVVPGRPLELVISREQVSGSALVDVAQDGRVVVAAARVDINAEEAP